MVRSRRVVRRPRGTKKEQYDSDEPEAYKDMPVPDKNSSEYLEDRIDEFHTAKISKLLAGGVQEDSDEEEFDDVEEVMPLNVNDSEEEYEEDEAPEEEDMESDLEGKIHDDLPNDMAWGHRKKMFYDSDYVTAKGKSKEDIEAEDQEEEEEAKNIQKRLVENLSEEDYDLNLLEEFAVEEVEKTVEKEDRIVKDLDKMSQKEKLKLLKKESPELLELIQDFKAKLTELKDELQPLVLMVKDGLIPAGKGANYLLTKQQLYLNYCTNISFYLVLKAKRIPAHNHPVIERLVTYRNLINRLSVVDARLGPQLRKLLSGEQQIAKKTGVTKQPVKPNKCKVNICDTIEASDSDLDEEAALQFYRDVEERIKRKRKNKTGPVAEGEEALPENEEMDTDGKRGITYQMAKNKGLTPKRRKIDRNPRVKHREKFRRAKIRRKGQVSDVRREETRYSGEMSGIRAGVKRSVKLK
ncbi:something about silencing protein 10 [Denticeps clupeoides]|uniref:Sas10 C-terminal domain-containing protein n=1 Tax=Denticeps clupeoides TaxID=299321 RepID=A0AAY4BIZ2_9TELE|nr:something about silencing protein 10 [Denticeps clupeoides]